MRSSKIRNLKATAALIKMLMTMANYRSNQQSLNHHKHEDNCFGNDDDDVILWRGLNEDDLRSPSMSMEFSTILHIRGMEEAIRTLYRYGILLVTNTPIHDNGAAVACLGAALGGGHNKNPKSSLWSLYQRRNNMNNNNNKWDGINDNQNHGTTDGPLRTLYGSVWSTTSSSQAEGGSLADSAYSQGSLPLHTDMTYLRDPPGLQIFTMVKPSKQGGESVFGDGWAAAYKLQQCDPQAFDILSQTKRRYRCMDVTTGWHLEANGSVISTTNSQGECRVIGIRHNDLDRLPDLPPFHGANDLDEVSIDLFYQELDYAHRRWDEILAQDETRLVIRLNPGDTVVVANQRCMHGRYKFETSPEASRIVQGCYVGQDELNSRFRMLGYDVE